MGSLQCAEPSAVHANTQPEPANCAAWAFPESRFHRQRHPQHVGAVEGCVLGLCRSQASRVVTLARSQGAQKLRRRKHDTKTLIWSQRYELGGPGSKHLSIRLFTPNCVLIWPYSRSHRSNFRHVHTDGQYEEGNMKRSLILLRFH